MKPLRARESRRVGGHPPTVRSVLLLFALGSAAAIVVVVVGGYFALRSVAIDQAKRETRTKVQEAGQLVEATLGEGLLAGKPAAVGAVDDLVVSRVLSSSIVRVKIWSAGGRVLYSDDAAEIGGRYALDPGQRRLLREGGAKVEVSDLRRPENVLDRGQGRLIEAYTRIRTPSGTPVLFEIYQRFGSVTASARRLLAALAPPILGAILLIVLIQVPLVWSLTRRLQRGHEEREALLGNAIAASARERRRVASYLHDGPVQEIAGLAFSLAPLADQAAARGASGEAGVLRATIERLRRTVRDLRALLVELHPPHLAAAGLEAAIADLVSPLQADGVAVSVAIEGAEQLDREQEALVYRVAQEAVRNVIAYADAGSLRVELTVDDGIARLVSLGRRPRVRPRDAGAAAGGRAPRPVAGRGARTPVRRQAGDQLERRRGHARRARGAVPMIRVAVADDHGVVRDGLASVIAAQPDMELVATAADGAEAVADLPIGDARRGTHGSGDAGSGRDRGDACDSRGRARDGRARAHLVLGSAADHRSTRRRRRRLPAEGRIRGGGAARHSHRSGGRLTARPAGRALAPGGEERARPARRDLAARARGARPARSTECRTS